MKKTFLISLLVIFSISSFGQKIRFTDSTNVWTLLYTSVDPGSSPWFTSWISPVSYSGSVMVGGFKYLILDSSYIREDSAANKVFIKYYHNPFTSTIDSAERILYDYNWIVSDTVNGLWITSIDSTMINGFWYKVWHFSGDVNVIEGIGSTNGFQFAAYPDFYFGEYSRQLICFQNNGISPSLSNPVSSWGAVAYVNFDDSLSCSMRPLKILKTTGNQGSPSVSPNPIDPSSKIIFPKNISSGIVAIYNDLGQPVINLPFQNKDELLIGDKIKIPGIYYYRVMDNETGKVYSGKFAKQ